MLYYVQWSCAECEFSETIGYEDPEDAARDKPDVACPQHGKQHLIAEDLSDW